jgi:hypothetical protein
LRVDGHLDRLSDAKKRRGDDLYSDLRSNPDNSIRCSGGGGVGQMRPLRILALHDENNRKQRHAYRDEF